MACTNVKVEVLRCYERAHDKFQTLGKFKVLKDHFGFPSMTTIGLIITNFFARRTEDRSRPAGDFYLRVLLLPQLTCCSYHSLTIILDYQ